MPGRHDYVDDDEDIEDEEMEDEELEYEAEEAELDPDFGAYAEADDAEEEEEEEDPTLFGRFREQLLAAKLAKYLKEFDDDMEREKIVIGEVPVSLIEEERTRVEVESETRVAEMERRHFEELAAIDSQAEKARGWLEEEAQATAREWKRRKEASKRQPQMVRQQISEWFLENREKINIFMANRARNVRHMFGRLRVATNNTVFDQRRVNWRNVPQQVEIRLSGIRGLKNKVSDDSYVLLVSKWTKLGGDNMRWTRDNLFSEEPPRCPLHPFKKRWIPFEKRESCEICQGWVGCTEAAFHHGSNLQPDLWFNTALRCHFPAVASIKPYMVLMFELIRVEDHEARYLKLKTARNRKGKHYNPYNLCANIGGRGAAGAIVGKKSRTAAWGAFPVIDSKFNLIKGRFKCPLLRGEIDPSVQHFRTLEGSLQKDLEHWIGNLYFEMIPFPREKDGKGEFDLEQQFSRGLLRLKPEDQFPLAKRPRALSVAADGTEALLEDGQDMSNVILSNNPRGNDNDSSTAATTVTTKSQATVVTHSTNDFSFEEVIKVDRGEKWKMYRFSIEPEGTFAETDYRWWVQLQYVLRAMRDELAPRTILRFLFLAVLTFCTTWGQLYMRGFGVYVGLWMRSIPLSTVTPKLHGLITVYQAHYMWWYDEVLVVCVGIFSNLFVILSLLFVGYLFKRGTGTYPEQISKFVYLFCLGMVVLPAIEILVDVYNHEQDSDLFRLIRFFTTKRYSVFFGVISFAVTYLISVVVMCCIIYFYTMRLHLNGILLDAYNRITVMTEYDAERQFLPFDYEVSQRELEYIITRAERWRGANGERRKVLVEEIITTDENDPEYHDVQVRIAIYTLDVDDPNYFRYKPKKIFRDFYILSTGAIVEAVNHKQPPSASYVFSV